MRIFIQASESQKNELGSSIIENSNVTISSALPSEEQAGNFDAFFLMDKNQEDLNFKILEGKPIFINEVIDTLPELVTHRNVNRINAWPTFLERNTWEVAGNTNLVTKEIFKELGKKMIEVKDSPGMVAARVIAMIINEAFYALKENVSTKNEIDLAMKLGTNYPFGPFEWSDKIGLDRIYNLLLKLSKTDERCIPSFEKPNG